MKRPERIHFETDKEYVNKMDAYLEYLRHEEWRKHGGREALCKWLGIIFTCALVLLGIYLYI